MAETFNCPNCGAPITYEGADPAVACPYCNQPVSVPVGASLRRRWNSLSSTAQIVIVLVIVVVVLPTCLGVFGSLAGAVASVCLPLLGIFLSLGARLLVGH